jgi:hypothetical protein
MTGLGHGGEELHVIDRVGRLCELHVVGDGPRAVGVQL